MAAAAAGGLLIGLLVLIGGLFSAQEEIDAAACTTWPGDAVAGPGSAPEGSMTVVQANIKYNLPGPRFSADLGSVVAQRPDFVSLNEQGLRSDGAITPAGYTLQRNELPGDMPRSTRAQFRSTAVLWRTDRWTRVAGGSVVIVRSGPRSTDDGRAVTWVTVRDADGGQASMVSAHHMVNPARFGPDRARRQVLYREGMERIQALVKQLSTSGPVFVAGDFNSQYTANDPWGPRTMLGQLGMRSTRDALGAINASIDYIFYQPSGAQPVKQATRPMNSDHPMLIGQFAMAGDKSPEAGGNGKGTGKGGGKGGAGTADSSRNRIAPVALQASGAAPRAGGVPTVPGFTAEQVRNAVAIVAAGRELGAPARAQAIAVMTAMGESGLRVIDYGDAAGPDSRGLFQQRDNGAWGTYADRMDPRRSALMFYKALLRVPGWQKMPPTIAAHTTQRNADPYHYEKYWEGAVRLFQAITGSDAIAAAMLGGATNECDQVALAAGVTGGAVTWPVPASMRGTDRKNWGGTGGSWASKHTGTDFSVPCGVPVYAATAGKVVIDRNSSWAGPQLVKVSTGPSSLTTWYAHMQKVTVKEGQLVAAGQQIGEVGAEGNVSGPTGCHLHFEVHPRNGSIYEDNINPSPWLAANVGKKIGAGFGAGSEKG
ncbi:hypothetical protein CCO04_26095 [Pimelobacter sp. 30-1]|nr:hypothetical protein [Pimelobacter sp. 30-1]